MEKSLNVIKGLNSYFEGNNLVIEGLENHKVFYLYDINGKLVLKRPLENTSSVKVPIVTGMLYFVRIDNRILRIERKGSDNDRVG